MREARMLNHSEELYCYKCARSVMIYCKEGCEIGLVFGTSSIMFTRSHQFWGHEFLYFG